ncbi:MAG: fused MFS/spermidine synthase, partial [Verrucomicrobia bacterium]|nr:fused MFS/spermidine synthase [Verrucomicrobiota bacterium]
AMPFLLDVADIVYRWASVEFDLSPGGLLCMQVIISAALLLVPTMLMGATLPLLGRFVTELEERVGRRVGRLYALNMCGAAMGCFLAGFLLIRIVGVMGTLYIAAAINLIVAGSGWLLSRAHDNQIEGARAASLRAADRKVLKREERPSKLRSSGRVEYYKRTILLSAFFVSGLVSIGYELVWMRSIVVPLGGFTYVFSAVLTAYLIGNVIGAWLGSSLAGRLLRPAVGFGVSLSCLGLLGVLYIPFFRTWFRGGEEWLAAALNGFEMVNGIHKALFPFLHSLTLFLLPAIAMGIGFPLALQAWNSFQRGVGQTTGHVYGINTIGSVAGGVATGFVLVPALGVQASISFLGLLCVWVGVAMIMIFSAAGRIVLKLAVPAGAVVVTVAALYVPADMFRGYIAEQHTGRVIDVREGVTTTVAVFEKDDGHRLMAIDNIQMAGDDIHRSAQQMLGHLGVLLNPEPRTVCSFGYGCGETVACLAKHELERIDCVEIAPEVVDMANEYFSHVNLGGELGARVNMIYMDGKNYLKLTDRRYDIIINDSNVHSTSGSAPLYTREHFQNALEHLNPRGLFITKLHLQGHPRSNFESILGTFMDVFPHVTVWFPTTRPFVFFYLVGSEDPQKFSPRRIDAKLDMERVRESADYLCFDGSADVLSCYIGDENDFRRYLNDPPINSDYHPFVEFNLDPRNLVLRGYFPGLIEVVRRGSVQGHLDLAGMAPGEREEWLREFDLCNRLATFVLRGHGEQAFMSKLMYSYFGLRIRPGYQPLLNMQAQGIAEIEDALQKGLIPPEQIVADMNAQIRRYNDFAGARLVKSVVRLLQGKVEEALESAQGALRLSPQNPVIHNHIGDIYLREGLTDKAREHYAEAVRFSPENPVFHFNLAEACLKLGLTDKAAEEYRQTLRIHPNHPGARERVKEIHLTAR